MTPYFVSSQIGSDENAHVGGDPWPASRQPRTWSRARCSRKRGEPRIRMPTTRSRPPKNR